MGPTKVIVKDSAIYEAKTGKLVKDWLTTHEELQDYANHHYIDIALPVVNKAGEPWLLDGETIYFYMARGLKSSRMKCCTSHGVQIVAVWAFVMMSPWSNQIAFGVYLAVTSSMLGWR